jgi:hypothetical protein
LHLPYRLRLKDGTDQEPQALIYKMVLTSHWLVSINIPDHYKTIWVQTSSLEAHFFSLDRGPHCI